MGGCFSVSLSCDQAVNQVSQCLCVKQSYIHNLEDNLSALETTMEDLKARRDDLSRRVDREENKGLRRLAQVQSLKLSYLYGKRVFMTLREVESLKSDGVFEVVSEQAQASEVLERAIRQSLVEKQC
ncbi:hypothetical protein BRARA_I01439 [Brassica rapa]|uniref:Uncharacterized protein n=1 Tax=Brassica campestris TaxID=3711 RepID=A0A397XTR9_BRACM|nr:hypothetical protein BRARA_I01439 [Brassica rapa]